ncbi:YraN family protein [Desulfitobacterium metallireducens]|uniref:UPF0102 protein DESME_11475 n=1 Tax=Desulfitobacterium metallireducens DSM 15288 TaxID=871968 RepID=W0EDE5_9FIRM|nr:YraN family protein [Desulfitobacterium metallireducens]AHF07558.1 hypothetical protein DESME_11475 [Desulfitobacterium metallireducens DSM 15288]
MSAGPKKERGQQGENLAAQIVVSKWLKILMRNFRCSVGEMDIIALEGNRLIFIEVRTRSTPKFGWGEESIQSKKRGRLQRIAEYFLLSRQYREWPPIRFDLIAIRWDEDNPQTKWIKGI